MNQINAQTPGKVSIHERRPGFSGHTLSLVAESAHPNGHDRERVEIVGWGQIGCQTPEAIAKKLANARLLAASYTAFDKAARALGLDAATLAEGIDLAALIRAAREAREAMENMRQGRFRGSVKSIDEALKGLTP